MFTKKICFFLDRESQEIIIRETFDFIEQKTPESIEEVMEWAREREFILLYFMETSEIISEKVRTYLSKLQIYKQWYRKETIYQIKNMLKDEFNITLNKGIYPMFFD